MPQEARDEAVAKIKRFLAGNHVERADLRDSLFRLTTIMEAHRGPHDPRQLEDFMTFTNDLDIANGQSFASVNGELLRFIEIYGAPWSEKTRFARYASASVASGRVIS
jgi:hypothetical protein